MQFFAIEGIDGSGKSTQIKLITGYMQQLGLPFRYLHFPRMDKPFYGELIARFLRGDFGDAGNVDPYLVAMLYAGDRMDASTTIRKWLEEGTIVLIDRYVCSNIAFQCAKVDDIREKEKLREWIINLEYGHNHIPKPDINILLDVPHTFAQGNLASERKGAGREYLKGLEDIHEKDFGFQRKVRDMYLGDAEKSDDVRVVNCSDENGFMSTPETVFGKIRSVMQL
jgi:dTMP kinase